MTYAAFLRAINVGGRGVVKMADLRDAFAAAGARDPRTVIQSGNVLFGGAVKPEALFRRITREVTRLLGAPAGIYFRTLPELEALVAEAPFGTLHADPAAKLYVAFFGGAASPVRVPLLDAKEAIEVVALRPREALIVSRRKPNGMYGFPGFALEKALGVPVTARNWTTVSRIVKTGLS